MTLTTDWGERDFFVAMVKGKLCSLIPDVRIFDLSHEQKSNDMASVSGIVRHGCFAFPEGAVHIVDVGCDQWGLDGQRQRGVAIPMLALCRGHYFICSDRKVLEQSLDSPCEALVELPLPEHAVSYTFLAGTLFCDVAAALAAGRPVSELGVPCQPLRRRGVFRAQSDSDTLEALVVSIDSYGNANLNVTYDEFETVRAGRRFRVELEWRIGSGERYEAITSISSHYSDVRLGDLLLTVSITGALQLAINKGSVAQLIGLRCSSRCRFIFAR